MPDREVRTGAPSMRALLSVYDKTGLLDLARGLADLGWELISSGGTAAALTDAGIACTEVAEVTGAPEMLGGRVKTLHPAIAGGILADRSKPDHMADVEARGIDLIDLVVCNLYPFRQQPSVEMIDVGGPTMVRAAAKNHASVGVVVDPSDYAGVLEELRATGALSDAHPPPPGPDGLRRHRRLRRRHHRLVRRGDAATTCLPAHPPPGPGEGRRPPLRREPPPEGRPATARVGASGWWDGVDAARRDGPVVPQPVRRRGGLAPRPRPRRRWATGRRWPSSSTPTRAGRRWPTTWPPPTSWRSRATPRRPSGGSWPSTARSTRPRWRRWSRRPRPTWSSPPSYEPGTIERLAKKRKNTRLLSAPAAHRRRPPPAGLRRRLPRAGAEPVRGRPLDVAGRRPRPPPPTTSGATPSWPGSCAATPSPTPWCW